MTNILLSPARIGPAEIPNRIVMPPMTTRTADAEGFVTDDSIAYYMARVRGGTGGRKPTAEFTIGSSVNSAVAAFSKALADRGKEDGVQVNCIHPSMVETDRLWRRIKAEMDRTGGPEEKIRTELCRSFGITRFGTVGDVANLVLFLVSPRGSWMHGATVNLDGGEIPTL